MEVLSSSSNGGDDGLTGDPVVTSDKAAADEARARGEKPPPLPAVGLRQRVQPFIAMLERCERAQQPIVWGV